MNPFDLVAAVLFIIAILLGFRSGLLPQLGGIGGAIVGGVLAIAALPLVEPGLADLDPTIRALAVLAGLVFAVGLGEGLGAGLGRIAGDQLDGGFLGALDRVAGAMGGAVQGLLIVWLAGGLLAVGPLPSLAQAAQTSVVVRTLDRVLAPPTVLVTELGRLLDASGLPDVFIGLEPLPRPPVELPGNLALDAITAAASASTVRVVAATCGLQSTGTGFAFAAGYVVTNAHVVAGGRTIRVDRGGTLYDATPVLFDSSLDVAVLHVPRLPSVPLQFAARDPERGALGAALGHPGGGPLQVIPAGVTGNYDARGLDIYGASQVTRRVIELRAAIDRGDSGGPFVLLNGTVGGVVFAEARSDPSVGYALSPTAVATLVGPVVGRTGAVGVGACTR
jgi:S1-C subfamily serine protease